MIRHLILLATLLALGAPASAGLKPELREITAGEQITIRPDRAYLLIRIFRPEGVTSVEPVLLRVPAQAELDAYNAAKREAFTKARPKLVEARASALRKKAEAEASKRAFKGTVPPDPTLENFDFVYDRAVNVSNVHKGKPLVAGQPESVYLLEGVPGQYIVYGAAYGSPMLVDWIHLCFCLGTVGFEAKPGVITDLGTFVGDTAKKRSVIPELAQESGFGPSSDTPFVLLTGTIRPATSATPPAPLAGQRILAADYHAVGKFLEPNAQGINRMVPIPGVLAYDNGKVIDMKSGQVAEDHF